MANCPISGRLCSNLKINHFSEITNGNSQLSYVCDNCIADWEAQINIPLKPLGATNTKNVMELGQASKINSNQCPACRTSLAQIKSSGKLGCIHCYDHFSGHLKESQSEKTPHGKVILQSSAMADKCWIVLHERLTKAITQDDHNMAAELKKKIAELEPIKREKDVLEGKLEEAVKYGNFDRAKDLKLIILELVDKFMKKMN